MTALERVLTRLFHSGWAARMACTLGLQSRVRTRHHEFRIPRANHDAPTLRIVFASDLHAGCMTDMRMITEACSAITRSRADIILLGGDFVGFDPHDVDDLVPLLARLEAPLGKFAVLGNHDVTAGREHVAAAIQRAGFTLVTNCQLQLPQPHDDICLCGLDDPIVGEPRASAAIPDGPNARIVLMHAPDGLFAIGDRHFDVALCGHTHGGQVSLPWGTPIVVPRGRLNRRFAAGEYELHDRQKLLVSRGVGCTTLPLRIFSPAEVHVCEFVDAG